MNPRFVMFPAALAALPLLAQVTPAPRRVSKDFRGELPFIWMVEGQGVLKGATLRLLDDRGQERLAPRAFSVQPAGPGLWQAWDLTGPAEAFKGLEPGRYTAEWTLQWDREGKPRQERTESLLRLGEKGDGWLQKAFTIEEAQFIDPGAANAWPLGATYALTLRLPASVKRIRYQLVEGTGETVLRPWQELLLEGKSNRWVLPGDASWPRGQGYLWILMEDDKGRALVQSKEVLLGQGSGGVQIERKAAAKKKGKAGGAAPVAPPVPPPPIYNPNPATDLLAGLDDTNTLDWGQTNRVATVTVGYLDEERNPEKLWPTDSGRPMSLGITGANKLGKPLYSVSYLLEQRATTFTDLAGIADQALSGVSGGSLPPGAAQLSVGGVLAPVIFAPGTVEDFLGKPLAAGYGFAATDEAGAPKSAASWVAANPTRPPVGLAAIRAGAAFKARLIEDAIDKTGYTGNESVTMTEATQPFALTLASQDPLGRVILSRPIGTTHPSAVTVQSSSQPPMTCDFNGGALPPWVRTGGQAILSPVGASPALALNPAARSSYVLRNTDKFRNLDDPDGNSTTGDQNLIDDLVAGEIYIEVGRMLPSGSGGGGTTGQVTFTASGWPWAAEWIIQSSEGTTVQTATTQPFSFPSVSLPSQVSLRVWNPHPVVPPGTAVLESDRVVLDDLSVVVNPTPIGFEATATAAAAGVVPGHSRTQYGTVDIPGQGLCTVTMVTDPDGSAVAEIKDPEGRTVLKVVNPDSTYTNAFLDFTGSHFLAPDPKFRGAGGGAGPAPEQKNLLTQYVFDSEGHLRALIPPKGANGTWGRTPALTDADLDAVLKAPGTLGTPLPYVTYNAYDASGHLVATYNPDEGLTTFRVDQKGRVYYSQTAEQRASNKWTRTLYDAIYRVAAVGEVVDPNPDAEALAFMTDAQIEVAYAAFDAASRSRNLYDAYQGPADSDDSLTGLFAGKYTPTGEYADPATGNELLDAAKSPFPEALRALLPPRILWGAFADGHLTRTLDENTLERYYYDQDGRIVIRWVSLKDGTGAWRHFGIGIYYDFAGRVKRLIYPDGPGGEPLQVVYTYDDLGRLFAVGAPEDLGYFARYAYQPTGELKAIVYGPGAGFAAKRMLSDPQGWLRELTVQGR